MHGVVCVSSSCAGGQNNRHEGSRNAVVVSVGGLAWGHLQPRRIARQWRHCADEPSARKTEAQHVRNWTQLGGCAVLHGEYEMNVVTTGLWRGCRVSVAVGGGRGGRGAVVGLRCRGPLVSNCQSPQEVGRPEARQFPAHRRITPVQPRSCLLDGLGSQYQEELTLAPPTKSTCTDDPLCRK
jgi:hypothetical protein